MNFNFSGHTDLSEAGYPYWAKGAVRLDFDYLNNRYYVGDQYVTLESEHDVDRDTSGFASDNLNRLFNFEPNVARRTNAGLLIEPDATNSITWSEDLSNAVWKKYHNGTGVNPVVTPNYGLDPDGKMTADRVQMELGGGVTSGDISYLHRALSLSDQTGSLYIKSLAGNTNVTFRVGVAMIDYNINVTSEWSRLDLSASGPVDRLQLLLYGNHNPQSADLLVSWAQMEDGTDATSYIKTEGVPVTRSADIIHADIIASTFAGMIRGIIVLDFDIPHIFNEPPEPLIYPRIFSINDGSSANVISVYLSPANQLKLIVRRTGMGLVDSAIIPNIAHGRHRLALGFGDDKNVGVSVNGAPAFTVNDVLPDMSLFNQMSIGGQYDGAVQVSSMFHEIAVLDENPSPARLQEASEL